LRAKKLAHRSRRFSDTFVVPENLQRATMSAVLHQEETSLDAEQDAFDKSISYVRALTAKYPGMIEFRTGAGHIFFDLIEHLPPVERLEEERRALCHLIEEHAYPLAASLYAQAVHITIAVSQKPLGPPPRVNALASFTAFDIEKGVLRHGFLSPEHPFPDFSELAINAGLTVECEPLNYHYHQLRDDRPIVPRHGASNFLINDYAGRNKDPAGGYEEKETNSAAPILSTKLVPRWLLEENKAIVVVPRISGAGGATHIPAYIRLLNASPHHHIYDDNPPAWKWEPAAKPEAKAAANPSQPKISSPPVAKPMPEEKPVIEPSKSFHYSFPAPGLSPLWYRPG